MVRAGVLLTQRYWRTSVRQALGSGLQEQEKRDIRIQVRTSFDRVGREQ